MGIASFDVFDTVLTRAVGSPLSVFLLLGRWVAQRADVALSPEAFARARISAEKRAYKKCGAARATLQDIYDELAYGIGLSPGQISRIMALEYELESRLLHVININRDRVATSRAEGDTVAFLSDMYLPSSFLRDQLRHRGLWQDSDRCYVSCEAGELKVTGGLFREVLRREGISASEVTFHRGNHLEGDVRQPQRRGLRVSPFLEGNLNRYEQILEAYTWQTEGLSSVLAGASRLARLNAAAVDSTERVLCEVAAGVMSPVLTGFLLWIFRRAHELKLQRLYFFSRDGEILLQMAQKLAVKLSSGLELRYLYASRQVFNLAGMVAQEETLWSWIWDETDYLSIKILFARLTIEPHEIRDLLESHGFGETEWDRNLSAAERSSLRTLLNDKSLRDLIAARAAARRDLVVRYICQEGMCDNVRIGLVDLGWHGSMQNALSTVLTAMGVPLPVGLYFGLVDRPRDERFGERECYFFDASKRLGFFHEVNDGWVQLLEAFCAGTHGTVTDLIGTAKQIEPVLAEKQNQQALRWGLFKVQQTACCFVDFLELDPHLVNPLSDLRESAARLLETFWSKPSRDEARVWGAFPWQDGLGKEVAVNTLARAYGRTQLGQALRGSGSKPHFRAAWPEGSFVLSAWHVRGMLTAIQWSIIQWRRKSENILRLCYENAEICEQSGRKLTSLPYKAIAFMLRPHRSRRLLDKMRRSFLPTAA